MPADVKPPQSPTDARDFLSEAHVIATGDSRLLAQTEHVQAAIRLADSLKGNVATMGQLLAAILLDSVQQPGRAHVMFVPKQLTDDIARMRLAVLLESTAEGTVVHLVTPTPAAQVN